MSSNDEGLEKSALLLLTLGADEAAEVLKLLGPKEVPKLGAAMAAMLKTINSTLGWEYSVLVVPGIYMVYRSYQLYLGRLEEEKWLVA